MYITNFEIPFIDILIAIYFDLIEVYVQNFLLRLCLQHFHFFEQIV